MFYLRKVRPSFTSPALSWQSPPAVVLGCEDVHVWCVDLARATQQIRNFKKILSPDELIRSERFYRQKAQDCFVVTRGVLRLLVGGYLGLDPSLLQFSYGPYGKPILNDSPLHFNLSHSGDIVLYAFTLVREVGVDVEKIRSDINTQKMTKRFFSPKENEFINALPGDKRQAAFFSLWTRKEAYIKGKGLTLSHILGRMEGDPHDVVGWSFTQLNPLSGYTATLAIESINWQLSCWRW